MLITIIIMREAHNNRITQRAPLKTLPPLVLLRTGHQARQRGAGKDNSRTS